MTTFSTNPRVFLLPLRLLLGAWFLTDCVRFGLLTPDWPGEVVAFIDANMTDSRTTGPAGWVATLLLEFVRPNAAAYGYAVLLAEAFIGIALVLGFQLRVACTLGLVLNTVFVFTRGFNLIGPHIDSVYLLLEVVLFIGAAGLYRGLDARSSQPELLGRLDANPQFALTVLRIGTGAIFAISAYDKWRRGGYARALGWLLENHLPQTAYGFYKPFLDGPVSGNLDLFAWAITIGETALALSLIAGLFTTSAVAGGIVLMINFHFAMGGMPLFRNADIGLLLLLAVIGWSNAGHHWGLDGWRARRFRHANYIE